MIERKYQTFWPRLGAGLIDALLFLPLSLFTEHVINHSDSVVIVITWNLLYSWGAIAYYVLMHGMRGQTVGKILVKVKVYDTTEIPLSMKQAVLRDIVPILSTVMSSFYIILNNEKYYYLVTSQIKDFSLFPKWFFVLLMMSFIWFVLEFITMLLNNKRRALHDYIAGSVVCRIV